MASLSRLLKESWTLVEDQHGNLAQLFYARLFLADPQLRDLFPVHLDNQRDRLLDAIVTAMQTIDDVERFDGYARSLGRSHRKFGVSSEHYGLFGAVLLDSLRTFVGQSWCAEYDQAWREAYDLLARRMIAGADEDTNPPFWHAEVTSHERRSRDIAVFTCRPLQPFDYRAGQYVSLECDHHPRLWRTYSIANAPNRAGILEFHVRAIAGGWVSGALVRRLRCGDMVRLAAPTGSMTLDGGSTRDIVCVAGGTGLAPIKALIQELTGYNRTRWTHLFFGARDRDDLYDLDELRRIATRHPWLSIVPACSEDATFAGERGNIDQVVARYGPWAEHDFFVSGSAPMVRSTLRTLAKLRIPSSRVRYDPFDGG